MAVNFKSANIISSFKSLRGNTRTTVIFEPMWGIPYVLFNFYLSLYMKSLGITDREIGYLISIGFVSTAVFSLFSGVITDTLGRKKTTLIFDLISWPLAVLIYAVSNSFWVFAVAVVLNGASKIVYVSINLMIIEDADDEQRMAAFNLQNIINISTGVITPLGGILVGALGIVKSERVFLIFAFISMTAMMIIRDKFYQETEIGLRIMTARSKKGLKGIFKKGLYRKTLKALKGNTSTILIITFVILFNLYIPIGAHYSLYFAPYMTEVLNIDESLVSILGGIIAATMFVVFVFVNPVISRCRIELNLLSGIIVQAIALFLFVMIPKNNLFITSICSVIYAVGFSVFKPFIDVLLAQVTEGEERAGIYSLINTITALLSAAIGAVSGYLYDLNPRLIYILSMAILLICGVILSVFIKTKYRAV